MTGVHAGMSPCRSRGDTGRAASETFGPGEADFLRGKGEPIAMARVRPVVGT